MHVSLKFQFILFSLLLVTLTVAVSSFFFTRQEQEVLLREMTRRGVTIARNLATTATDSLVSGDNLALATFVDSIMRNEGVAYATILDEKGTILAHSRIENVGKAYVEPAGLRPLTNESILIQPYTNEAGEKVVDLALPILLRNGVRIGTVHAAMAQAAIEKLVDQAFRETVWIAVGLLLIGVVLSFFFTDFMFRPVHELLRGAQVLGEGNLNYHIRLRGKNELSTLGEAFNLMASRLKDLYIGLLRAMARALAARDKFAGGHDQRVSEYAVRIAEAIGLKGEDLDTLRLAALVQNLGHIAVPDAILENTGKLSPEEYNKLKEHVATGADILNQVQALSEVVPLVYHHHERFDGRGYPKGLAGKNIPLGARILAVADAFDAMISDQKHRRAMSRDQAVAELKRGAGTQFDPEIVAVFIETLPASLGQPAVQGGR